jgi:hypothetical protein
MRAVDIYEWMTEQGFGPRDFEEALDSLRKDGLVDWSEEDESQDDDLPVPRSGSTPVVLTRKGARS